MEPIITTIQPKILIGKKCRMSLANQQTQKLWKEFGSERKDIRRVVGTDLYSVEVYPEGYFRKFDPTKPFEKWAAVEVSEVKLVPEGMGQLTLPEGLYAMFYFQGAAEGASKFYQYIYSEWLPGSAFSLDVRPHFAVMEEQYDPMDHDSEETIWIPVK